MTGVAGFIGSHLLEELLSLNQVVIGVDNFATGFRDNLENVLSIVPDGNGEKFSFHEGDICDFELMEKLCSEADIVLHQAALGSVPRSVKDPVSSNRANVDGFLSVITAAKNARVSRFVYASSSSVYGDCNDSVKVEDRVGSVLSPYAATKKVNEIYASVFARLYGLPVIGLRYFNVFGPRQDPDGPYAAVIPRWIGEQMAGKQSVIYGDGLTSRDFCFVKNVVQANILAGTVEDEKAFGQVYNIALGGKTSLTELFDLISDMLKKRLERDLPGVRHEDFRAGDIRHSCADVSKARELLGYEGGWTVEGGMKETVGSYLGC